MRSRGSLPIAVVVAACCLFGAIVVVASGGVLAGDQLAVLSPSPHDVEADPGEEVEIEVNMQSQGGHAGEGVESIQLVGQYHPDYVEVTDIEGANWLEQGDETEIHESSSYYHESGTVMLEKQRDPAEGGAVGRDTVATLTLEIAEDAEPGETMLSFGNSNVYLEREFQLPIHHQEVSIVIGGEDDEHESFDHPDPQDRDALEEGTGNDDSEDGDDGGPDDETETDDGEPPDDDAATAEDDEPQPEADDGTDAVPGFAIGTTVAALFGALILTLVAVRHRSV